MAHLPVGECTSFRRHPVDLLLNSTVLSTWKNDW